MSPSNLGSVKVKALPSVMRSWLMILILVSVLASVSSTLCGCGLRYGGSSQDKVLATLRDENANLRERVAGLEREREELVVRASAVIQASSGAANVTSASSADLASQIAQALPAVVSIEIDSLSGPSVRDPQRPTVNVYIIPKDGRNRFTQVVGSLVVEALWQASDPKQTPDMLNTTSLGSVELSPLQVREAYRSGFGGTNYMVELPVQAADRAMLNSGRLVLRARLTDLLTGKTHEADHTRVLDK